MLPPKGDERPEAGVAPRSDERSRSEGAARVLEERDTFQWSIIAKETAEYRWDI